MLARFRVSVNALQLIDRTNVSPRWPFFRLCLSLISSCSLIAIRIDARRENFASRLTVSLLISSSRLIELAPSEILLVPRFIPFVCSSRINLDTNENEEETGETKLSQEPRGKSTLSSGEVLIKNFSRSFFKDESLPVGREYSAIFCAAYSLRRGCATAGNCDFIIQSMQRATPFVYLRTVPLWLWIHAVLYSLSAAMNAIDLSSDNLPSTSERRWNKEFREFRFIPRSSSIVAFCTLNDYDRSRPTISPCTRERWRNCTKHEHDV